MALSSLPPEQQEALVAAVRRGSPDAFTQIYEAFHRRIYNLAARMVGDREDAADITQEVFLTAYRRLPEHRGEMRLEPWLYKVAVNACYDHLRRRSRRPADALPDADALPAPIDEVERAQLSAAVCEALDQVSPRYRAALLLKDIHGCDNGEVADVLGIGTGTAGVLLFRARKAFQKAFGKLTQESPVNVSAIGLAAFLPELPVPESLAAPPALLAAAPTGLADVAAHSLDSGGSLLDPTTGFDAARMSLDPAAAESLATGPLLSDPTGPLASLGALAPAAPLAASTAAATATKAGTAVLAKIVLAVVGMTALAGGGVAVGTLESPASPPDSDTTQAAALPSTAPAGDSSSAGSATGAPADRSRLLRPGDDDALLRRAQNGAGDPAARGDGSRDGNGAGANRGGGDGRSGNGDGDDGGSAAGQGSGGSGSQSGGAAGGGKASGETGQGSGGSQDGSGGGGSEAAGGGSQSGTGGAGSGTGSSGQRLADDAPTAETGTQDDGSEPVDGSTGTAAGDATGSD